MTRFHTKAAALAAIGLALGFFTPAKADDAATMNDLRLESKDRQSREKDLEARLKKLEEGANGGLKLGPGPELSGGDFTFKLHGRFHVDWGMFDKDNPGARLGDGSEIRRERIGVEGTMYKDWAYKWEMDFAGQAVAQKDAWIGYTGLKPLTFKVGNHNEPITLDQITSDLVNPFIERSMYTQAFTDSLEFVLGASVGGTFELADNVGLHADLGLFQNPVSTGSTTNQDAGVEGTGRAALDWWYDAIKTDFIHLGGYYGMRHLGSADRANNNFARFRARPGPHFSSVRLIDTGNIDNIDNLDRYGGELAGVWGPFSLAAEYMGATVERHLATQDNLDFTGYYVSATYFVTGQSRGWSKGASKWDRTKDAFNAWELAIRWDGLNLNDEVALSPVRAGAETNITGAVNYYVNPWVRFMFNVSSMNVRQKRPVTGGTFSGETQGPMAYWLRAQVDF